MWQGLETLCHFCYIENIMKVIIMRYRAKLHPYLDLLCDSMGRVFVPQNGPHKAHWTFGSLNSKGYRVVTINRKRYKVARLICETFHGLAPEDRPTCDHIDRNRDWNVPWNLRWSDYKQQNDNRQVCYDSLAKYGIRQCEDPAAYKRALLANNHEYAERKRAHEREYWAQNTEQCRARSRAYKAKHAEHVRAYNREWKAKQRALGRRYRTCPDGSRQWLTDEEFFKKFGYLPKK